MWLYEFGRVEDTVFYVFCAVAGLDVILTFALFLFACFFNNESPSASMDFFIGMGSLGLITTVILRGLSTTWGHIEAFEMICQIYPSILLVSLTFFVGGMLLKAAGIFSYFKYRKHKNESKEEWKPNLWMSMLAIIDAIVILAWAIAHYFTLVVREYKEGVSPVSPVYECVGLHEDKWRLAVTVYHGALLLIAALLVCFAIAKSRATRYQWDTSLLALAIYNMVAVVIASVLLMFLYAPMTTDKTREYSISGGLMLWTIFFTTIALLIGRIIHARRELTDVDQGNFYEEMDDNTLPRQDVSTSQHHDVATSEPNNPPSLSSSLYEVRNY